MQLFFGSAMQGEEKYTGFLAERKRIEKSLRASKRDGAAFAAMEGSGTSYISAFAVALNATKLEMGLLMGIPQFFAAFAQLWASGILDYFPNRKKIISRAVLLQALTWLPILAIPFLFSSNGALLLIVFYTVFLAFGSASSPMWQSLMGDLVDEKKRGSFFGSRNALSGMIALIATLSAGQVLNAFDGTGQFTGFALVFSAALCFRLVSRHFLGKMHEPPYIPKPSPGFSFQSFVMHLNATNFGSFAKHLSLIFFFMYFASPFYAMYLLNNMGVGYLGFSLAVAVYMASVFIAMNYWGPLSDMLGNRMILIACAAVYSLVPAGWIVNHALFQDSFILMLGLQSLMGVTWAGIFLSSSNFIYDNTQAHTRARAFAYYSVIAGTAILLGCLAGGAITSIVPDGFVFGSSILFSFAVASAGMLVSSVLLARGIREVRTVMNTSERELYFKILSGVPLVEGMHVQAMAMARAAKTVPGLHAFERVLEREAKSIDRHVSEAVRTVLGKKETGSKSALAFALFSKKN